MVVPERLRWLVSEITEVTSGGPSLVHLPDPDTCLVFRARTAGRGDLLVVGPRTHATYHLGKDLPVCLRFRLRPGAARLLFGAPVSELVDRIVPIGELLDGDLAAYPGQDVVGRLEQALPAMLAARSTADLERAGLLRTAAGALDGERREALPALAGRLAVSERHLRDLFSDGIGLPPKRFQRIARLRKVLARGGTRHWAQLAVTAGYYDQSHMTAEFRTLMGITPAAYFAGRLPALRPC
ncbi:helix-turn-helix domain-containing protein [Nonomuraea sediminis]|uniref:helix-turn-helix domain-containing protein n=1 Tax=Nonomuraea sediminis TaxID=2835864 RepID=UPI001BDC6C69|nr:helix-turn-helix domain-containing protein [Nonomuraea sediminis]